MEKRDRKYIVVNPNDETPNGYCKPVSDNRYLTMRAAECAATKMMKKEHKTRFLMGYFFTRE
jgi:hypothetical protein